MPDPRHRARSHGRHHRLPDERLRLIVALAWALALFVLAFVTYAQAVTSW